ncbi:MAG: Hsp70 family protein [Deltaproteobacteria bacterium]|nr:Hsp70 family protein [Deltaproteobacteria bacterium]
MLAIDFGTSRTKVAYMDTRRGEARLYRIGRGESPSIPSLFYLGPGGERLVGDDAYDKLEGEANRVIRVLKRRLRDRQVRAGGQKATPEELLTLLLTEIRRRSTDEVPAFQGFAPTSVALTIPAAGAGSGPAIEELMKRCAEAAGFDDVTVLTEPEAAALGWRKDEGRYSDEEAVVVLDCGGGTVDWACLRRVGDRYRLYADCPAGGDEQVGGEHLDEDLYALARERLAASADAAALDELDQHATNYMNRIRRMRERFCQLGAKAAPRPETLTVGSAKVEFTADDFRQAFERRFIAKVCDGFGRYLDEVRRATNVQVPKVLLVGGSFQTTGLREALRDRCRCTPTHWDASEYAPVRGAVWAAGGIAVSAVMPAVGATSPIAAPALASPAAVPVPARAAAPAPQPPAAWEQHRWYALSDGITSPVLTTGQLIDRWRTAAQPDALHVNLVGTAKWGSMGDWPAEWPDLRTYVARPAPPLAAPPLAAPPLAAPGASAPNATVPIVPVQREATRPIAAFNPSEVPKRIDGFVFQGAPRRPRRPRPRRRRPRCRPCRLGRRPSRFRRHRRDLRRSPRLSPPPLAHRPGCLRARSSSVLGCRTATRCPSPSNPPSSAATRTATWCSTTAASASATREFCCTAAAWQSKTSAAPMAPTSTVDASRPERSSTPKMSSVAATLTCASLP